MLRKILKITAIVLLVGFVAVQFVRPDFTNPPVVDAETLAASSPVPSDVDQILRRSCFDCHSHETRYPWYSKVSPFNWFLAGHIEDGRREVNFSVWNTYSTEQKVRKLEEICDVIESAEMPLPSYLWIHWDASLSKENGQVLCEWAKAESQRLAP